MPMLEELRLKTGQIITEDWYDALVDYLEELGYGGVITVYGYVSKDLIPVADLLLNLGIPLKRFKEIHSGYGYFTYEAWIADKKILKDGDPITVEDFGTDAENDIKNQVQSAIDASTDVEAIKTNTGKLDIPLSSHRDAITGKLDTLASKEDLTYNKLTEIDSHILAQKAVFQPIIIDKIINANVNAMTDVFASNLTVLQAGRVRFKFFVGYEAYAYVKHRPAGTGVDLIAILNAGASIPPGCWHEFDFTVMNNDQLNFQISESTTLTLIVYNIPNA